MAGTCQNSIFVQTCTCKDCIGNGQTFSHSFAETGTVASRDLTPTGSGGISASRTAYAACNINAPTAKSRERRLRRRIKTQTRTICASTKNSIEQCHNGSESAQDLHAPESLCSTQTLLAQSHSLVQTSCAKYCVAVHNVNSVHHMFVRHILFASQRTCLRR